MPVGAARELRTAGGYGGVPGVVAGAGKHAAKRFLEFFAANIRNRNTRSGPGPGRPGAPTLLGL